MSTVVVSTVVVSTVVVSTVVVSTVVVSTGGGAGGLLFWRGGVLAGCCSGGVLFWRGAVLAGCWRFERDRNGNRSTDPPIHRSTDPPIHRSTDPPIRSTDDLCAAGRVRGCWRVERGRNGRPIYAAGRVCIVSSRLVVSLGNSSRFSISSLARWSSEMPPPLFKQRGTFAPPGAWNMLEGYLSRFTLSSSVLKVTCSVLKVTCSVLKVTCSVLRATCSVLKATCSVMMVCWLSANTFCRFTTTV